MHLMVHQVNQPQAELMAWVPRFQAAGASNSWISREPCESETSMNHHEPINIHEPMSSKTLNAMSRQ